MNSVNIIYNYKIILPAANWVVALDLKGFGDSEKPFLASNYKDELILEVKWPKNIEKSKNMSAALPCLRIYSYWKARTTSIMVL
jgi:hypothetical protein